MPTSIGRNLIFVATACLSLGCQKQTTSAPAVAIQASPGAQTPTRDAAPSTPAKVHNGPFGLAGGMAIAELTSFDFKPVDGHPGIYTGKAPKPIEGASEYIALAMPETGVCRINAKVDVAVVNGSGDQVKAKVDQLAEIMAVKYGLHSHKETFIGQDVYRRNPQYWMMGLKEDSVVYSYLWEAKKTAQPLPPEIRAIEISARAASTDSAWAAIQYTFTNFDACLKENQKRKASNL